MKVFITDKKIGETPLEALRKFVKKEHLPPKWKYTYAGRLDPMAKGVLLILANATQQQKEKYLELPKVYESEILLGLGSDTSDLLGIPQQAPLIRATKNDVLIWSKKLIPSITLPIPAFSSIPVNGKPAFTYARAGKKVEMPKRKMEIKSIEIIKISSVGFQTILKRAIKRINSINGDFRQKKILTAWNKLRINPKYKFQIIKFTIHCGSGTYIRSIAEHLGKTLGTKAMLYNLERTRVGRFIS